MKTFGVMRTPNTPALLIFHSILLGEAAALRALAARTTPVTETICESLWIVFWLPSARLRATNPRLLGFGFEPLESRQRR